MDKKAMLRELFIRVSVTTIFVAIAIIFLHADLWLLIFPVVIGLTIWLKYRTGDVD